jgi:hypothetical protein
VQTDPLGPGRHRRGAQAPDPATFAQQQRDLYIAAGDTGFSKPQPTITRFVLLPPPPDAWRCDTRHHGRTATDH